MNIVCKSRVGHKCTSNVEIPSKKGDYIYLVQIGNPKNGQRFIKIGTSNNVKRRIGEELRQYKQDMCVLWVSPCYKKYTTLRVEEKTKDSWRALVDWEYIPNDRFLIPDIIQEVCVVVRNEYRIKVG